MNTAVDEARPRLNLGVQNVRERLAAQRAYLEIITGSLALKDVLAIVGQRALGIKPTEIPEKSCWAQSGHLDAPFRLTDSVADTCIFFEVVRQGEYNLPSSLDEAINGFPIVDIGGNIGASMAYFAKRYPNSPILSIEPHPRNAAFLRRNAHFYGDRVLVEQKAFSLNNGDIPLVTPGYEERGWHAAYSFMPIYQTHTPTILAPAITPEDIADYPLISGRRIGLLKIDIEGAEKAIFESGRINQMLQMTNVLAIESHDEFIPGCSSAVAAAAAVNSLKWFGGSSRPNTTYYCAEQLYDLVS